MRAFWRIWDCLQISLLILSELKQMNFFSLRNHQKTYDFWRSRGEEKSINSLKFAYYWKLNLETISDDLTEQNFPICWVCTRKQGIAWSFILGHDQQKVTTKFCENSIKLHFEASMAILGQIKIFLSLFSLSIFLSLFKNSEKTNE